MTHQVNKLYQQTDMFRPHTLCKWVMPGEQTSLADVLCRVAQLGPAQTYLRFCDMHLNLTISDLTPENSAMSCRGKEQRGPIHVIPETDILLELSVCVWVCVYAGWPQQRCCLDNAEPRSQHSRNFKKIPWFPGSTAWKILNFLLIPSWF